MRPKTAAIEPVQNALSRTANQARPLRDTERYELRLGNVSGYVFIVLIPIIERLSTHKADDFVFMMGLNSQECTIGSTHVVKHRSTHMLFGRGTTCKRAEAEHTFVCKYHVDNKQSPMIPSKKRSSHTV